MAKTYVVRSDIPKPGKYTVTVTDEKFECSCGTKDCGHIALIKNQIQETAKTLANLMLALNNSLHHRVRDEDSLFKIKDNLHRWICDFATDEKAMARKVERILST